MKNLKKWIVVMVIVTLITIISSMWYSIYYNNKISEAKQKFLMEELEKNKISESEKIILEYKKKNDIVKKEIDKINIEIENLLKDLTEKEFLDECIKLQIKKAFEWKTISQWYCEKKADIKEAETPKIAPVSASIPKQNIAILKSNFKIEKSNLFMCKEVKARFWFDSDEIKCSTMMSMVSYLETENWTTWVGESMNNMFWIKLPTDTKGLMGKWKVWDWKHIIFETKEMSKFAFAYYYMKYHDHRNLDNFVNVWVSWNNIKYKSSLKANYGWIYQEYNNL